MRRVLMAVVMVFFVPALGAQEIPKRPRFVGEWCEYELDSSKTTRVRREVVAVTADGGFTIRASGDVQDELRVFNADHRMIARAGRPYAPAYGGPLFPLKVGGREGGGAFTYPHPMQSGVTVSATAEIRPIVAARISVPAGTFDTLKVEMVANYRLSNGATAQWKETAWYPLDPALKFAVKSEFIDFGTGGNSYAVLTLKRWGAFTKTPPAAAPAKQN